MLRQPVVSPPHEHNLGQAELDQSSKEVHDPNSGASAGQIKPKKRRPLIRSPSRDKLIKLLLQQPRGAGMEDRSGGTGHEHEHAQSHERPKQSDMANHKKDGLGIPAEAAALAASASASAAADSLVVIPLIVFTFNRAPNLKQTMDSLLLHRPEGKTHLNPIFISQDGDDEATRSVAMGFVNNLGADPKLNDIHYLNFHWETSGVQVEQQHMMWTTYYKIATHYGFALTQVLDGGIKALPDVEGSVAAPSPAPGAPAGSSSSPSPAAAGNGNHYDHVILIEDDMEVSLDFYSYFRRTRRILDSDPSLLCVSAWNDNGRRALVGRPEQLYRSECFPGLGWMINRRVWDELKSSWAKGFWDDWLREPKQRKGRSCVFPEMNRVFTFGEKGSSALVGQRACAAICVCLMRGLLTFLSFLCSFSSRSLSSSLPLSGQFYDQYLRGIILNSSPIRWDSEPLDYLSSKQNYRRFLWEKISRAKEIAAAEIEGQSAVRQGEFRIRYENTQQLDSILRKETGMTGASEPYRMRGRLLTLCSSSPPPSSLPSQKT